MEIEQLARFAYAAYGEATDGRNYRGEPMPAWEDLGTAIQSAWKQAVKTVAHIVSPATF